jgi:hypothetical protein
LAPSKKVSIMASIVIFWHTLTLGLPEEKSNWVSFVCDI